MKNKILTIALGLLAVTSCNFLDVVPNGTPTQEDIFSSALQTERFLYSIYNYIPNLATYRYMPDMCAGGDLITAPNGQTRYFPYKSMLYNEENSNNTYYGLWDATSSSPAGRTNYDMYKGIRYAWTLIANIDNVPNMSLAEKETMTGECYFLIAYFHWILMEHYGPVVIVDHEISVNAPDAETMLPRSSWDDCAKFVCETFDKAAELLPATQPRNELGRATAVAAKAFKARCLMYTASPLVNGNKDYASFLSYDGSPLISGTYSAEKWQAALDATKEAIDLAESNGHKLYEDPASAALPDAERGRNNYYNCFLQKWNDTEFLFAFGDQTGPTHIQHYATARQWDPAAGGKYVYTTDGFCQNLVPTLQLVETYLTKNGLPMWADPTTKSDFLKNKCMDIDTLASGERTARLHFNRDPRFYATVGFDRGSYISNGSSNQTLYLRSKEYHGYTEDVTHEYISCSGYLLQKFISISTTYNATSKAISYAEYAFPYLRLAELYLDYAEADFELDGQLSPEGVAYLNKIHHRAGLPNFDTAWAALGGLPTGETMRKVLHEENMIELAGEARQYNNIRRWNIANEMVGQKPEALNVEGRTAEDFYTIVPMKENKIRQFYYPKTNWMSIPLSEIEINYKLVQNPGY